MHVVANLKTVATESHFFFDPIPVCQHFVDLTTLREKEVQEKLERVSLTSLPRTC